MTFMQNLKICCEEKRRLLRDCNLFKILEVDPPYILLNKIKRCETYKNTLNIKNVYAFPKILQFRNDFPSEINTKCPSKALLKPDETFSVDIFFEPTCPQKCYEEHKRYSFTIFTDHPKVGFDVPVIIKRTVGGLSVPESILMCTTSPNIPVYFCFPLINFTMENIPFQIRLKPCVTNLRCVPYQCVLPARDSYLVFLEAVSPNMCPVLEELLIRFSKQFKSIIRVECYMKPPVLHPSSRIIRFPMTQLGIKVDECILLCNETNEVIKYKWCRNKTKAESQQCSCTCTNDKTCVKKINEYFEVKPKSDVFTYVSSESALFTFTPPKEFGDECNQPPFVFTSTVYLACSTSDERMEFTLVGIADGPKIEILESEEDLGEVFVGEKKCCDVIFTNCGKANGTIQFSGTDGRFGGIVKADPNSEEIEPLKSVKVTVEFFATSIGQFIEKLIFKVKNGKQLSFILKGTAIPLDLKVSPSKLDFGDIPFGIIQKQYLEITNTHRIPIVVSPKVETDGNEDPLILFIDEEKFEDEINYDNDEEDTNSIDSNLFSEKQSHTHYSFWTLSRSMPCRDEFQKFLQDQIDTVSTGFNNDMLEEGCECDEEEQSYISSDSLGQSTTTFVSKISSAFNEIIDNASLFALKLVTHAIENKIAEEPQAEDKIISTILDKMYTFEQIDKQVETMYYTKRNWSKTPEYPREVLLESKSLYMEPGQTLHTLICVVANRSGRSLKNLTLRITPISEKFEGETKDICSRALSVTVPISFNCIIPLLHLSQTVNHVKTHIGVTQQFFLRVKNLSKVAGFVCFNIIPRNNVIELLIYPRKFLIKPEGWRKIHFKVTPFRTGETCLTGVIAILGNKRPMIYKIIINTEPPAISINPVKIKSFANVLTNYENIVKISNISPAEAQVRLSLEKNHYMHVMPNEGVIPPGVTLDVTLFSFFRDNCKYTNNLRVDVEHNGTSKVSIRFDVQGIPLIVECNKEVITNGVDFGTLFTSSKPFKALVKFTNSGELQYKLFISKPKKSKDEKEKGKFANKGFDFDKCSHILNPGETKSATIEITGIKPQTVENEFSFDVVRSKNTRKIHFASYTFRITFVQPFIKWSKEQLCFDILNSQLCDVKDRVIENVMLKNKSEIQTAAELKVEGSFKFVNARRGNCAKQLQIELKPKESKMLEVIFTPQESAGKYSAIYEGKVFLKSGEKNLKSLDLLARVVFPVIVINEEELDYFARQQEFYAFFKISNPGQLVSVYKWQLMEEVECPLNYIKTSKMKTQKTVSQEILTKPSHGFLDSPINLEQEYLDTFAKLANLIEDSDDEEVEEVEEKSEESSIASKTPAVSSKLSKEIMKKKSGKSVATDKTVTEPHKNGKSGKKKKSLSPSVSEDLEPVSEPSFTSLDIKNIINKITPKISVDLQEVADEVTEFLYLHYTKGDSEDIIDDLEPENCTAELSQPNKFVYLDHYKGCIDPESARDINVFFAGHDREITHKARYELEVAAGNTTGIDITIFNINATVQISHTHFDIGYQPWYKVFQRKITLTNCNQMTMKINIAENAYLEKFHKLYMGFLTVNPNGTFYILNDMIVGLTIKIYMGLSGIFKDGFGVEVNNNIATPVTFTGKTGIPMVSILNVERPFLESFDRKVEYKTLNKMFLKEVDFIKVFEPEPYKTELYKLRKKLLSFCRDSVEEESLKSECYAESSEWSEKQSEITSENSELHMEGQPKLKDLYIGEDGRVLKFKGSKIEHRAVVISKLDKELEDYHVLDYPESYPPVLYIEKKIETSRFLESLKLDEEVRSTFRTLANKYVLTYSKNENQEEEKKNTTLKIKDVIVEPLPFNAASYYLPLEFIRLNEELSFTLELFWHGPGKLMLAVRTTVAIPGLKAEFSEYDTDPSFVQSSDTSCSDKKKFLVYTTTPEITQDFKYINKTERDTYINNEEKENSSSENCDTCKCSFLCRKHSYDLNSHMIHTRDVLPDRKAVRQHYSSLLKDKKDPFVLCQLLQEDCTPMDEISFALTIKFIPTDEFYEEGTIFEDYLIIDVHLGPSVPILLRGPIRSNLYSPENSVENESLENFD